MLDFVVFCPKRKFLFIYSENMFSFFSDFSLETNSFELQIVLTLCKRVYFVGLFVDFTLHLLSLFFHFFNFQMETYGFDSSSV